MEKKVYNWEKEKVKYTSKGETNDDIIYKAEYKMGDGIFVGEVSIPKSFIHQLLAQQKEVAEEFIATEKLAIDWKLIKQRTQLLEEFEKIVRDCLKRYNINPSDLNEKLVVNRETFIYFVLKALKENNEKQLEKRV